MDFTVSEGSLVSWRLELNREPAEVEVSEVTANESFTTMTPHVAIDGNTITCDLGQLDRSKTFELHVSAADGMQLTASPLKIHVKKDEGPVVKFKLMDEQIEVTPTTEVALSLDASDDYGLTRIGVEYQINGGEKRVLWQQDLQGDPAATGQRPGAVFGRSSIESRRRDHVFRFRRR